MAQNQPEHFITEKISPKTRAKILERVEKVRKEINYDFEFWETPDAFVIKRKDENGQETETHFTKVDSSLLIKTEDGSLISCPLEDVIEANLKFPKEDFSEALKKIKKRHS